jgi:Mor family transcriptional regulator
MGPLVAIDWEMLHRMWAEELHAVGLDSGEAAEVARLMGARMRQHYGGEAHYFPKLRRDPDAVRRAAVAGGTLEQVARQFYLSTRHVRRLLKWSISPASPAAQASTKRAAAPSGPSPSAPAPAGVTYTVT